MHIEGMCDEAGSPSTLINTAAPIHRCCLISVHLLIFYPHAHPLSGMQITCPPPIPPGRPSTLIMQVMRQRREFSKVLPCCGAMTYVPRTVPCTGSRYKLRSFLRPPFWEATPCRGGRQGQGGGL